MAQQGEHGSDRADSQAPAADARDPREEESVRERLTRFVTSAKGAVLTVGALAGAVGAVIALLPKHEHAPSTLKASFSRVTAYPNVALDEYEERFGSHAVARIGGPGSGAVARVDGAPSHAVARIGGSGTPPVLAVPYRLVAARDSPASARPSTPSPASESPSTAAEELTTTSPETSTTEQTTETGSITSTDTSETTTTDGQETPKSEAQTPFKEIGGVLTRDGNGTPPAEEHAVAKELSNIELPPQEVAAATSPEGESTEVVVPDACGSSACAVTPMIDHALTDDPDPVKAARAVAAAFADSRGRVVDNKLYPSGVAVNYTIDLVGFAHREAILEWSLWSKTEGGELPKPWLRNVIAKEIKPKADDESFSSQFWIPAPASRGDYVVHLTVYDDDHIEHGEAETEPPFH